MIKVLVVDDSALMRRLLGNIFKSQDDFEVAFARDGVEALAAVHEFKPDVVTLDIHMPNMDGLACLDRIMIERPTRVIMVSSLTDEGADETFEAMQLGAVDFFPKPDGAVSLVIDEMAAELIEKVRAAAKSKLRASLRLAERIRLRTSGHGGAEGSAPAKTKAQWALASHSDPTQRAGLPGSIVLVGASTGGPPALDALLSPLAATFPWPIIIAQHMPSSFTGPLARRLNRLCALSVQEITQPTPIEPGHVYVARGDADAVITMRGDVPFVMPIAANSEYRWHPSVDRLVSTAMQNLDSARLIGVLMTGMGDDGAASMTRLRAQGGRTIAEAEETAVVWGMPGELVKAGGAELVAPLDKIAPSLMEWAR